MASSPPAAAEPGRADTQVPERGRARGLAKSDAVLAVGLVIAALVIFSTQVTEFLDYMGDIERVYGLRLLPGLLLLASLLAIQQFWKRTEARVEVIGAARAAQEATERAAELSRLVAFGHALARSLDSEAIRTAVAAHLPMLVPGRRAWAMTRTRGHWDTLVVIGDSSAADREQAALAALGEGDSVAAPATESCFPMIVAGTPIGVLGVAMEPALTDHQRSVLSAAAALLAVSLKNCDLFREVRENSVRDGMTGCFNRTHTLEVLDAELRRARRSQMPLSIVMFDLDHFKAINDRHGHLCGDAVLTAVGQRMRAVLRGSDIKCRYGGEEFLVILPETPLVGAQQVSETLRREIAGHAVEWSGATISVTASFGITCAAPGEADALAAIARADAALYRAKQAGRNRVHVADEQPAPA
jgi:diguanylate cyclase (GGDEF)-like protein